MRRLLLFLLLLAIPAYSQTHVGAMQDLPNVFTSTNQFTLGITSGPILFANLGTIGTSTTMIFISDATLGSSPCTGGGTGALAIRINSAWNCNAGGINGLVDPGSNGLIKRTALNTTAVAVSTDVISLFAGCSGTQYLGADGNCYTVIPGLADPGGNGIVKRTALNTTAAAASADIVGLFSTCSGTQSLGADGMCHTAGTLTGVTAGTGTTVTGSAPSPTVNVANPVPTGVATGSALVANGVAQPAIYQTKTTVETRDFNWSQVVAQDLSTPGAQTVTLTPCPFGIDVTNTTTQPYRVYVPTTNAEATVVTGGTCTSGGASGTIIFTTAVAHSASSNTIQSASAGFQEAINAGCGTANGNIANPNCRVALPYTGATANAPVIQGTVYVHASSMTIEGNGTLLKCATRDRCIFLGDTANSNHYGNVTIKNLALTSTISQDGCLVTNTQRVSNVVTITVGTCSTILTGDTVNTNFTDDTRYWGTHGPVTVSGSTITYAQTGTDITSQATPGTVAILNAAIEDNAFPGVMDGIISTIAGGGKFNQFFIIDNDQAATIRNFDANGFQSLTCTANHCGSYVYASGNTAATPVIWVDKSNISPQCHGNGITNYANNTVRVSDSVIQGTATWGVNTTVYLGSFGGTQLDNIYNEEGACTGSFHPYYPSASYAANNVGVLFYGSNSSLTIRGGEQPNGNTPAFLVTNSGSTQYNYYVVARDTTSSAISFPLYAGYSLTNATGTVTVQWPHVPPQNAGDTIVYDIIRMQPSSLAANGPDAPVKGACIGGSTTACGSVTTSVAQCSGLVCTFTDTASANTTSYAIGNTNWFPALWYWPGGLVFDGIGTGGGSNGSGRAFLDTDLGSANASPWISVMGNLNPTFYVNQCSSLLTTQWSGAWRQCLAGDSRGNSASQVGATVLQNGAQSQAASNGIKGRLNFSGSGGAGNIGQFNIITLVDSSAAKTFATAGNRPPWDNNDTWIGLDQNGAAVASAAQLAFGAPVAISNYIATQPNAGGTNWLERLTSSLKSFTVPITTTSQITSTLATGTAPLSIASTTPVATLTVSNHPTLQDCGSTSTCANTQKTAALVVRGSVAFPTATTVTLTALPFTSASSYSCTASDVTTAAGVVNATTYTSGSSVIFTETNGTNTDTIRYSCIGF